MPCSSRRTSTCPLRPCRRTSPEWLGSGRRSIVKTVIVLATRTTTRTAATHRESRRATLCLLTRSGYRLFLSGVGLLFVPTYSYACADCGHRFDIYQSFDEDSLTT